MCILWNAKTRNISYIYKYIYIHIGNKNKNFSRLFFFFYPYKKRSLLLKYTIYYYQQQQKQERINITMINSNPAAYEYMILHEIKVIYRFKTNVEHNIFSIKNIRLPAKRTRYSTFFFFFVQGLHFSKGLGAVSKRVRCSP